MKNFKRSFVDITKIVESIYKAMQYINLKRAVGGELFGSIIQICAILKNVILFSGSQRPAGMTICQLEKIAEKFVAYANGRSLTPKDSLENSKIVRSSIQISANEF